MLAPWKKSYDKLRQPTKKQIHYFTNKGPSSKSYGFSSSHIWMWELDYKESWVLKNWCFWTVVFEKTLESHLDCKEIQPVHPKGNQSWVFIGMIDAEAEAPILWPPNVKNWFMGKDADARTDWRQEEKGTTKDEMVGWYHRCTWVWASSRCWWWEAWCATVHGVAKSQTWLSDYTELNRLALINAYMYFCVTTVCMDICAHTLHTKAGYLKPWSSLLVTERLEERPTAVDVGLPTTWGCDGAALSPAHRGWMWEKIKNTFSILGKIKSWRSRTY